MNGLIQWHNLLPARRIGRLEREVERLFGGLRGCGSWPGADEAFLARGQSTAPRVHEDEDGFSLAIALPGLGPEDVAVRVEDAALVVEAKADAQSHGVAWGPRPYRRVFTVPDSVDEDAVAATMKDGVLRVTLPKRDEAKPRRRELKIKAG